MEPRRALVPIGLIALGAALGWGIATATRATPAPSAASPETPPAPATRSGRDSPSAGPAEPSGSAPSAGAESPLGLDGAITAEEREFLAGALRAERERRARAVLRPGDDGLTILERVLDHGADPGPLLETFDEFRRPLTVSGGEPARFAEPGPIRFDPAEPLPAVVEFGPGRFVIERGLQVRQATAELEIRGAGIDRTELVLGGDSLLSTHDHDLANLWVHDLTLVDGGPAIQVSGSARGTVIIENVSFRGWPSAGFSSALGIGGRAYLGVRHCDFLRGPENGQLAISVRGQTLALIEGCLFADAGVAVSGSGVEVEGNSVRLRDCTFENTRLASNGILAQYGPGAGSPALWLDVEGCFASYGAPSLDDDARREQWGAQYARSIRDLELGPELARPSVADVLALLGHLRSRSPGASILRVAYVGPSREGALYFDVYPHPGTPFRLLGAGAAWTQLPDAPPRRSTAIREDELVDCLSLADVLAGSGLPSDTRLAWVEFDWGNPIEVQAGIRDRTRAWTWDATTGALRP